MGKVGGVGGVVGRRGRRVNNALLMSRLFRKLWISCSGSIIRLVRRETCSSSIRSIRISRTSKRNCTTILILILLTRLTLKLNLAKDSKSKTYKIFSQSNSYKI
jgi:hypothetical protein